jgi:tetratricopeptide (TPR) repeat protein
MKMPVMRNFLRFVAMVSCLALLFACSGPEAKKMKFFAKGKALYEKGDYVRARLELRNAIQIDPKFADAYAVLGMVESRQGNLQGAFAAFTKATELNPLNYDAQAELGRLFLLSRELEKAREKAVLVLKARPRHEVGLLLRGAIYLADGDAAGAIGHLREMERQGITRPDIYLLLASAYRQMKNDREAEQALREGLRHGGDSLPLHRALAEIYAAGGRVDEAAAELRTIIAMKPAEYNYSITLAGLYWDNGREAEARAILAGLPDAVKKREECVLSVAGFYISRKQVADAEQLLCSSVSADRKSFIYRFALSDLYNKTGRPDKAAALLKECLGLEKDQAKPRIIDTKNALARIYMERGELPESTRLLDEIFKVTPRNLDANLTRGRLAMLRGDGDKAVAAFQVIASDKPQEVAGYLLLAEAQFLNRRPNMAMDSLQQAQKLEPDSREVMRAFARYYLQQRDFAAAEGCLRKALARNPQALDLQVDLGDLFRAAGDVKQAESAYSEVKRSPQGAVIGRVKLSELYQETGRPDRATAELSQAIDMAPQAEDLFARLIRIHVKERRYAEATARCRERISKRPGETMAYYLLGGIQEIQGDYRKAEESLLQAQRLSGNAAQFGLALAQLQVKEGKLAEARKVYEDILAKQPDSWAVANDFACMLSDHGNGGSDLQRALTMAQQVNSRFPDNPLIMDTLGWICYRKGDYQKAAQLLERSAQKMGANPLIRYHAGMALYRSGKADQARAHLRFAAESRESFPGKEEAVRMASAGR